MALIGKIREKSWLLVLLIGLALLAFILTDYEKMMGGSGDQYGYGTIDGEMIDYRLMEKAMANFEQADRQQFAQQQKEYTAKDQENSQQKAFKAIVDSVVMQKEFDALGIDVSENEFNAYLYGTDGFSVLPDIAQGFTDSLTGMFNKKALEQRVEQMKTSEDANERALWEQSKVSLTIRRKQEKYFGLLNQGVYVSKLEAKDEYLAQKEVKSISFVMKRFSEIKDEEIKVTDEALQAYFEEHKNDKKYEIKIPSREVKYFNLDVTPSHSDSVAFNKLIKSLRTQFETTKNDSTFILANSDMRFYTTGAFATAVPMNHEKANNFMSYPLEMDTVFKTASVGQIVGPYSNRGVEFISKVIGFTPAKIKARHILLRTGEGIDEAAKDKQADSILKLINKDNFVDFVNQFSEDGSKSSGGDLGEFMEADMVAPFANFCVTEPIGKIGKVKSQFGIHIVEVLERSNERFPKLASIQKTLKASQNTIDDKNAEVNDMLYDIDAKLSQIEGIKEKMEMFDSLAAKGGYFARNMNLNEKNLRLYGLNTEYAENKILELAFGTKAKVGDVYPMPIKDGERYLIAMLTSIKEEGMPTFENIETILRADYIKDEKAKKLMARMAGEKNLDKLAAKVGVPNQKADVTFANPQITGGGYDPEVVGALFSGLKDGSTTLPIVGKTGVYVVKILKTTKAPATTNYKVEQEQMLAAAIGNVQNDAMAALTEKLNVLDNRRLLKAGVRR